MHRPPHPTNRPSSRWSKVLPLALFLAVSSGCATRTTVRLGHVLEQELGRPGDALPGYRCTMGAHRGSSVAWRENTLASLAAAEQDPQVAFVEFDVQFTRDREIVLFHDLRLLRVYKRFTSIGDATLEELRERTRGEITLYRDAMDVVTKRVNIEIKSQGDDKIDAQLADAIIADVRARGREKEVMISSISTEVIRYIKQTYPDMPTGQIYWLASSTYLHWDRLTEGLYKKFAETQADYLMLHVANLRNIEDLLKLKPPGKTIVFWDFDDRMYIVHKDRTDRLWGEPAAAGVWRSLTSWW